MKNRKYTSVMKLEESVSMNGWEMMNPANRYASSELLSSFQTTRYAMSIVKQPKTIVVKRSTSWENPKNRVEILPMTVWVTKVIAGQSENLNWPFWLNSHTLCAYAQSSFTGKSPRGWIKAIRPNQIIVRTQIGWFLRKNDCNANADNFIESQKCKFLLLVTCSSF